MATSNSTKRAAIYARVSTDDQTTENQLRELRQVAERCGWKVAEEFVDNGISGMKGRDKRPAFDALLKAATRREVDVVMAWSVDRGVGRRDSGIARLGRPLRGVRDPGRLVCDASDHGGSSRARRCAWPRPCGLPINGEFWA